MDDTVKLKCKTNLTFSSASPASLLPWLREDDGDKLWDENAAKTLPFAWKSIVTI